MYNPVFHLQNRHLYSNRSFHVEIHDLNREKSNYTKRHPAVIAAVKYHTLVISYTSGKSPPTPLTSLTEFIAGQISPKGPSGHCEPPSVIYTDIEAAEAAWAPWPTCWAHSQRKQNTAIVEYVMWSLLHSASHAWFRPARAGGWWLSLSAKTIGLV